MVATMTDGQSTAVATPQMIPAAALALIASATSKRGWRDERFVFTQPDVTAFTAMFRDRNPAHRPDYQPYPIVPGLMIKSALPALAPELCDMVIDGFKVRFIGDAIMGVAEVPVGSQMCMQIRTTEQPSIDGKGRIMCKITVVLGFQARGDTKIRIAAMGPVTLMFEPE